MKAYSAFILFSPPIHWCRTTLVGMGASSEVLEHTADVRLHVAGPTLGALLGEGGRALAQIELGRAAPAATGDWRTIDVRSTDRDALLVDWLNELVYLAETEHWVATEFEIETATAKALRVRARGVLLHAAPTRVKAATFHGLRIAEKPDGLEAEVILDV